MPLDTVEISGVVVGVFSVSVILGILLYECYAKRKAHTAFVEHEKLRFHSVRTRTEDDERGPDVVVSRDDDEDDDTDRPRPSSRRKTSKDKKKDATSGSEAAVSSLSTPTPSSSSASASRPRIRSRRSRESSGGAASGDKELEERLLPARRDENGRHASADELKHFVPKTRIRRDHRVTSRTRNRNNDNDDDDDEDSKSVIILPSAKPFGT